MVPCNIGVYNDDYYYYITLSVLPYSLCTDPSSKGGKGLCNYEPKLAEPSRNLFWRPRNESLNSTDSFFPSGILSMAFISLFSNFSCKVLSQGQTIVSKTEDRLMKINAYFDKLF